MITKVSRNKLPRDVKVTLRAMVDRIRWGNAYPGLNFGVYNNESGHGSTRLPPNSQNQTYYEGRIGETPLGGPGSYRVVLLMDDKTGALLHGYFTRSHYRHFFQFE